MTDQPTEMNDAKFREIVLRALDRIGEPSIGHVMIRLGMLEHALQACWDWGEDIMPDVVYAEVKAALRLRTFTAGRKDQPPTDA